MLLSSCVIWRYRSLESFRRECPVGDPALQALIVERLDPALAWLESLGAEVVTRRTGNPRTVGVRFDPRSLTDALVRAAGRVQLGTPLPAEVGGPVVLATGGFGGELARRLGIPLRANPWSEGDGRRFAEARDAAFRGHPEEFYGRLLPDAEVGARDFVRAAQLYGRFGVLTDERGQALAQRPSWSEVELPPALVRAGGRGWLVVAADALERPVRERSVADMVAVAAELGGEVRRAPRLEELGLSELRAHPLLRRPPFTAVRVVPAVTHTIGGIAIDAQARVLRADGSPVPGLYAAGADVGGISTGGYASGLAAALVLGRVAAETVATAGGTRRAASRPAAGRDQSS